MERSGHNVLQGTFCFQLSTAFPFYCYIPFKRWSPRGHILKTLASKLQVLENCRPRIEDSSIFGILKIL